MAVMATASPPQYVGTSHRQLKGQHLQPAHDPLLSSLRDDIGDSGQQQQQEEEEEFLSSLETTVLSFFLSVIIVMTVFGNLLVMVALCKDRHLR